MVYRDNHIVIDGKVLKYRFTVSQATNQTYTLQFEIAKEHFVHIREKKNRQIDERLLRGQNGL